MYKILRDALELHRANKHLDKEKKESYPILNWSCGKIYSRHMLKAMGGDILFPWMILLHVSRLKVSRKRFMRPYFSRSSKLLQRVCTSHKGPALRIALTYLLLHHQPFSYISTLASKFAISGAITMFSTFFPASASLKWINQPPPPVPRQSGLHL